MFNFANSLCDKHLSLKDAQNEKKEMLEKIEELEEKIDPFRKRRGDTNEEKVKEVVENAKQVHNVREKIIRKIGKIKRKENDLSWIKNYDFFEEVKSTLTLILI